MRKFLHRQHWDTAAPLLGSSARVRTLRPWLSLSSQWNRFRWSCNVNEVFCRAGTFSKCPFIPYRQSTVVNDTTLSLPWKNVSMQRFSIRSANDIGPSVEDNVINVYRSGSPQYELNENNIAKVYHNSSYTLSWSPPANLNELVNYTVFWCLPKIELPNQCKVSDV